MPEVTVSALEVQHQILFSKAQAAFNAGNIEYALDVCAAILAAAPGCLPVRKFQRAVQLRNFAQGNRLLARTRASVSATPFLVRVRKETAEQALASAGKILALDPTSAVGLKSLAQAASALDLRETALFAWEALCELKPGDGESNLALAGELLKAGKATEAVAMANRVLAANPTDAAALKLLRDASVAQTITAGNWSTTSSIAAARGAASAAK